MISIRLNLQISLSFENQLDFSDTQSWQTVNKIIQCNPNNNNIFLSSESSGQLMNYVGWLGAKFNDECLGAKFEFSMSLPTVCLAIDYDSL